MMYKFLSFSFPMKYYHRSDIFKDYTQVFLKILISEWIYFGRNASYAIIVRRFLRVHKDHSNKDV